MELTVGYVAGAIAAGFFIATQLSALALALILSWRLHDNSSAATWTVAATSLLGSHWTWLANSDSNFSRGVSPGVLWSTRVALVTAGVLALGSVVTPFGLYSTLQPGNPVQSTMTYARDPSPFGYGTPPRSSGGWSRICGVLLHPCPFTGDVLIKSYYPNGTINFDFPYGINVSVPSRLLDVFGSRVPSATVSNFFDIQWRRWKITRDKTELYSNGSDYVVADSRRVDNLLLNNALQAVEGLVVDTKRGGIGFRNHTVPGAGNNFHHGVVWDEDLLFVEPETVCVDTNLTLDFTISNYDSTGIRNNTLWLTDRGGFANLDHTHFPWLDRNNTQANADLWGRAYMAAWVHNAYTAFYLNVSNPNLKDAGGPRAFAYKNSAINSTFALGVKGKSGADVLHTLQLSNKFGDYLLALPDFDNLGAVNPFDISQTNLSYANEECSGQGSWDFANISNIAVACGQMRPPARRVSPGSPLVLDEGSAWSQNIFACASAARATIKTTRFSYNRTDGAFDSLEVLKVQDKDYSASNATLPLWGVEDTGNRYSSWDITPIWGLVPDRYADHQRYPNVSTVRQPWLYLPGYVSDFTSGGFSYGSKHNLPGADFALGAFYSAYAVGGVGSNSVANAGGADYTGTSSLAMSSRWRTLSANTVDAALIPNLIFTDVAASIVVGTKSASDGGAESPFTTMVTPWKTVIRYRMLYAIPAIAGAAMLTVILLVAATAIVTAGAGLQRIRRHLNYMAPGRIYTLFLYPDENKSAGTEEDPRGVLRLRSSDWNMQLGDRCVDLSGDKPSASEKEKSPLPEQ